MPLFRDISPAELDLLLARFSPVRAPAGQTIIRQGEPGDRFYVIRSWAVDVVRGELLLARLGRGDAFGEIALLLGVSRTTTVQAVERTALLTLGAEDFRDLPAG